MGFYVCFVMKVLKTVCKIWFVLPLAGKKNIESSKASKPLRGLNGENKIRANVI